jgi:flagellar protein FliL
MAKDTKKKNEDGAAAEAKPVPSSEPKAGGKDGTKMLMILVIVAIVLGLGGLGAGGYFIFTQMQAAKAAQAAENPEEATPEIVETNIFFEEFPEGIVNLQYSDQCPFTYLKYAFSVEVESEEVKKEIEEKLPKLTSAVEVVMSNRDWNEISSAEGRDALAKEAMEAMNNCLPEGKCISLFFTTFVAQ